MNKLDDQPVQAQPPIPPEQPGWKDIVRSVLSAAIGVQSRKNQERDFKHGKARVYIIAGIIYTMLFIGTVFLIVTLVLKKAGH
ncbi:MAG TPA: DUF2970 domain-containing protein [Spongiibacteraceae bacterium]|nr:DUF2970 domain-containing protein [Spongiibacteraceae bacterium]